MSLGHLDTHDTEIEKFGDEGRGHLCLLIHLTDERTQLAIGKFEHASLQINFGTLDFAEAQKSMRLFAKEVIPAFA